MATDNPIQLAEQLQPEIIDRFKRVIGHHELAHAYLLVGPSGSGKKTIAQWIALRLFCQHVADGQPDGTCPECQRIISGNHPDVVIEGAQGRQIKVDAIRHIKSELATSGMEGSQKFFVINDAEKLTTSAANSLLKFIEEPGDGIYIFLLTTNKSAILPTVQSRTQIVELQPLSKKTLTAMLSDTVPEKLRPVVVGLTDSTNVAQQLCEDDWLANSVSAVERWFKELGKHDSQAIVDIQTEFMPLAKDRTRQQALLDLMSMVWRDTLMIKNGVDDDSNLHFQFLKADLKRVADNHLDTQILKASELTLGTRRMLDNNINFQSVAESLTINVLRNLEG